MTKVNDGGPAFPVALENRVIQDGMTLRDYFAAKALPIAYKIFNNLPADKLPKDQVSDVIIAKWSYQLADAMIKARSVE